MTAATGADRVSWLTPNPNTRLHSTGGCGTGARRLVGHGWRAGGPSPRRNQGLRAAKKLAAGFRMEHVACCVTVRRRSQCTAYRVQSGMLCGHATNRIQYELRPVRTAYHARMRPSGPNGARPLSFVRNFRHWKSLEGLRMPSPLSRASYRNRALTSSIVGSGRDDTAVLETKSLHKSGGFAPSTCD